MNTKFMYSMIVISLFCFGCSAKQSSSSEFEPKPGNFYSLEEVENQLTDNDILNICYRNNFNHLYDDDKKQISVDPTNIKTVEPLAENVREVIINDYFNIIIDDPRYIELSIRKEMVSISVYCGIYQGYYVLRFSDLLLLPAQTEYKKIAGYNFVYPYKGGNEVVLWGQK